MFAQIKNIITKNNNKMTNFSILTQKSSSLDTSKLNTLGFTENNGNYLLSLENGIVARIFEEKTILSYLDKGYKKWVLVIADLRNIENLNYYANVNSITDIAAKLEKYKQNPNMVSAFFIKFALLCLLPFVISFFIIIFKKIF